MVHATAMWRSTLRRRRPASTESLPVPEGADSTNIRAGAAPPEWRLRISSGPASESGWKPSVSRTVSGPSIAPILPRSILPSWQARELPDRTSLRGTRSPTTRRLAILKRRRACVKPTLNSETGEKQPRVSETLQDGFGPKDRHGVEQRRRRRPARGCNTHHTK